MASHMLSAIPNRLSVSNVQEACYARRPIGATQKPVFRQARGGRYGAWRSASFPLLKATNEEQAATDDAAKDKVEPVVSKTQEETLEDADPEWEKLPDFIKGTPLVEGTDLRFIDITSAAAALCVLAYVFRNS
ncbi:hypothetical protein CYMTET_19448 [Cymbomonas tetramitiformis]|uniref:Uncharacterized protein n=1 Tax=Cymbomonas tetramitiformis TaxID=36881 RepID=A0AAE0L598_9CHLO|nr:hypothetical protein CYMTET_19448 [Cymbomonas tetramitiformis]